MRWWMGRDSLIEGSGEITEMPLLSFSCALMKVGCLSLVVLCRR